MPATLEGTPTGGASFMRDASSPFQWPASAIR